MRIAPSGRFSREAREPYQHHRSHWLGQQRCRTHEQLFGGRAGYRLIASLKTDQRRGMKEAAPTDGVDGPLTASMCQDGGRQRSPATGAIHGRYYYNWS